MRKYSLFIKVFIYCVFSLILGCASTRMTSIWKDPAYSPKSINNVMVVGVSKHESMRRLFEDEFVKQLKANNIKAVASYTLFSLDEVKDKREAIKSRMQQDGIDSIIVTRLIDKKTEQIYYPPTVTYFGPPRCYFNGWYNCYDTYYSYVSSPGYSTTYNIVRLESNLYDVSTDRLLWSGLSESFFDSGPDTQIRGVVAAIVKGLLK